MKALPLRYEPFEPLVVRRPTRRIEFLAEQCAGRKVLDLGAADETAVAAKRDTGLWLHQRIYMVASQVIGLDSSVQIPVGGMITASNARIERGDVFGVSAWLNTAPFVPEVIVAGELIEHLDNPLSFLKLLKADQRLSGATLLLSTPNATAFHNCVLALFRRESTHEDHLGIFSYKTLHTLLSRAGFDDFSVTPYFSEFPELKKRVRSATRWAVTLGEGAVNALEWTCPLMSFGYIVEARI
jgi:hypothetical protein